MRVRVSVRVLRWLIVLFLLPIANSSLGQNYDELQSVLISEFPESSQEDGRWVFFPEEAEISEFEVPQLNKHFPNYRYFELTMTNYLGYHVNKGSCVVLFDSARSKIILVEPLWFSGVCYELIKSLINLKFDNKEDLLSSIQGTHQIMERTSGYRFVLTGNEEDLVTYDMVYFEGDSYTTEGPGIVSTVNYTKDGIWREIEVVLKDLKIKQYVSINPRLKDREEYKDSYKYIIK